jgi:hypothetical protein
MLLQLALRLPSSRSPKMLWKLRMTQDVET